jgi:hypothetical protein
MLKVGAQPGAVFLLDAERGEDGLDRAQHDLIGLAVVQPLLLGAACRISDQSKNALDLPDVSNCLVACQQPPATLHGVVFDILGARTVEGEFSNVTRGSAGKGTVRYAAGA